MNLLPPGGRAAGVPSSTPEPIKLKPTWTPSPTLVLTPPNTPPPTWTPIATDTPFSLVPPTRTPKPTSTPKAPFSASVQQVESTIIHPELGCGWFGVGGSVVDESNAPVLFMTRSLSGSINPGILEPAQVYCDE